MPDKAIKVLCADDNPLVAEALAIKLRLEPGMRCIGLLRSADRLVDEARRTRPDVVLLDLDMPGRDPLDALGELTATRGDGTKTLILSGHLRADDVRRALDAGAWGYLSKSDGTESILDSIRRVARGEFAFGPTLRSRLPDDRRPPPSQFSTARPPRHRATAPDLGRRGETHENR